MIQPYRTLVDAESLDELPKSGKRKEAVMRSIVDLANLREEGKARTVEDPVTRYEYHISKIEGFLLTWWVDHPVKRVIVIDINSEI